MANKHAAEKAIRVSLRRRTRNRIIRSAARTQVRHAVATVAEGDATAGGQAVREAVRSLDKAAGKGIIKKNNASRRKARLMKKLNQARAAATPK